MINGVCDGRATNVIEVTVPVLRCLRCGFEVDGCRAETDSSIGEVALKRASEAEIRLFLTLIGQWSLRLRGLCLGLVIMMLVKVRGA